MGERPVGGGGINGGGAWARSAVGIRRAATTRLRQLWDNFFMSSAFRNPLTVGAMVVGFGVIPAIAGAQSAMMQVGATVKPQCRITVDDFSVSDDRSPAVKVTCGKAGLRALRVSTNRGEGIAPAMTFAGSQLLAGGEVVFVVPQILATLTSTRLPVIAPPPPPDRRPVTVTLDF